ncbi:MAG: 2'-5' RNA ligase family protein [bacterium]
MLLAIAYPDLSDEAFTSIQKYRKANDRMYGVIDPHFTLVFALDGISKAEFSEEVMNKLYRIRPISFTLHNSVIKKDSFSDLYYAFLVPEEGYSALVKLHDVLYSELLSEYLRLDLDYIPHITIGNSTDQLLCEKMINKWNASSLPIRGVVSKIDIVEYENDRVSTIEIIQLQ